MRSALPKGSSLSFKSTRTSLVENEFFYHSENKKERIQEPFTINYLFAAGGKSGVRVHEME